jgi:uncharacterized metal-binding protein
MPNGTVHSTASALLAIAAPTAAVLLQQPIPPALAISAGCLVGLVLTPDLDVDDGCISIEFVRHTLGRIPALIWQAIWWPYAVLIQHRSWLSHGPVISTLIRLAYVAAGPALVWWLVDQHYPLPAVHFQYYDWMGFALAGLMLADTLHFVLDVVTTGLKHEAWKLHHRRRFHWN